MLFGNVVHAIYETDTRLIQRNSSLLHIGRSVDTLPTSDIVRKIVHKLQRMSPSLGCHTMIRSKMFTGGSSYIVVSSTLDYGFIWAITIYTYCIRNEMTHLQQNKKQKLNCCCIQCNACIVYVHIHESWHQHMKQLNNLKHFSTKRWLSSIICQWRANRTSRHVGN